VPKITPFPWFDGKAEEAANFYVSVFKNSKTLSVSRYGDTGPGPKGTVMTVAFELDGQQFVALNGGPHFTFSPAISFVVSCETQEEVDHFWEKLSEGGKEVQCGWLEDKYGVSWQVVPRILPELLQDKNSEKTQRVLKAMMKMVKLDIKGLQKDCSGPTTKNKAHDRTPARAHAEHCPRGQVSVRNAARVASLTHGDACRSMEWS
jgi:predicted 3-demethylubiquinone-9 3-methyltransferase (glyoxalase superfamily)